MSNLNFLIRIEQHGDAEDIRAVTQAAFESQAHSTGNEAAIVDSLRRDGALLTSLVAVVDAQVVGHVAFSPVTINGQSMGWVALGPLSVTPALQRRGVGQALVSEGLKHLWHQGIKGCVLLGSKKYYCRFGFNNVPDLVYPNAPAEHFMAISLDDPIPVGEVAFHQSFDTA